jgi:hypothetical protein
MSHMDKSIKIPYILENGTFVVIVHPNAKTVNK